MLMQDHANTGLSLAWSGKFQEAMTIFDQLPDGLFNVVDIRYQYLRCNLELGCSSSRFESTGCTAYDRLLNVVELRVGGRYKEAITEALTFYDDIHVPNADREIVECLFQLQSLLDVDIIKRDQSTRVEHFGKIVQFWDKDIPDDVEAITRNWANSGHQYQLFNERSAHKYILGNLGSTYAAVFLRCSHPAMKADFFRLAYLANEGGIYVDADECLSGNIDHYLEELNVSNDTLVCTYAHERVANNNFLICKRFNQFICKCLQLAVENIMMHPQYPIWRSTGPGILGMAIVWHLRCFGIEETLCSIRLDRSVWNNTIRKVDDLGYKNDSRDWRSTL